MIQVFGTKKCRDTQALLRFLKERRLAYHLVEIDSKAPSPGELDAMARACGGYESLLDKEAKLWKDGGFAWKEVEPRDLLLEEPLLLKTPVLRSGKKVCLGRDEAFWKTLTAND